MYILTTGQLAQLFSIKKSTIRYYVDEGLLHPKRNEQNDYYTFLEEDIYRLYQVLVLKESGISIKEIKQALCQESLLGILQQAKKDVKAKINTLNHLESRLSEIIQDNKKYILNECVYIEYPSRYLKKVPAKYLENNTFLYSPLSSNNLISLDTLSYVFIDKSDFVVCIQSTKEKYDFMYPKGLYASKTVIAEDEKDLLNQIDLFMSDFLFELTNTSIENLLVYENVHCSVAYSEKMIFTMEVKM